MTNAWDVDTNHSSVRWRLIGASVSGADRDTVKLTEVSDSAAPMGRRYVTPDCFGRTLVGVNSIRRLSHGPCCPPRSGAARRPALAQSLDKSNRRSPVNENNALVGRYQIVAIGKGESVLLDTATGLSWSLARDVDTLQLGWRPLEESWPEAAFHQPPDRPRALPEEKGANGAAAGWKPRLGLRGSRVGQSGA